MNFPKKPIKPKIPDTHKIVKYDVNLYLTQGMTLKEFLDEAKDFYPDAVLNIESGYCNATVEFIFPVEEKVELDEKELRHKFKCYEDELKAYPTQLEAYYKKLKLLEDKIKKERNK
jgi:hypothetical protein